MTYSEHPQITRFYGRRKGRVLSQHRQNMLEICLPKYLYPHPPPCQKLEEIFDENIKSVCLEIGFGGGEHLAEWAHACPEIGFVGAEPFINGVASLVRYCEDKKLKNVKIWPDDVRLILPHMPPQSLSAIYIMFPDPWPKKRHANRRILNQTMLNLCAQTLKTHGTLRMASDHACAKSWLLEEALKHPDFYWTAQKAEDWQKKPENWPQTRYMHKALKQGRTPNWLEFQKKSSPLRKFKKVKPPPPKKIKL